MKHLFKYQYFAFILMLFTLFPEQSKAHKEWVHQYILHEAYKLLKVYTGSIPEYETYLGSSDYLNVENLDISRHPFDLTPAMTVGVWLEDVENVIPNLPTVWNASDGHFWDADISDNAETDMPWSTTNVANAWTKARYYWLGTNHDPNFEMRIKGPFFVDILVDENRWRSDISVAQYESYGSFFDMYCDRQVYIKAWTTSSGRKVPYARPVLKRMWMDEGRQRFYHTLGRLAHLLGDMSVPAHVHGDTHPCKGIVPFLQDPDGDQYELWCGGNDQGDCNEPHQSHRARQYWNAETAREQGGLFWEVLAMSDEEALRYLYYTVNQITDHFPSFNVDGYSPGGQDNSLQNGSYPYLEARLDELGAAPDFIANSAEETIGDEAFNLAIRATATLLYITAVRTGLIECSDNLKIQNENIYGLSSTVVPYQASNSITAGEDVFGTQVAQGPVIIHPNAKVKFEAGSKICLEKGFSALSGSTASFSIVPQPCSAVTEHCSPLAAPISEISSNGFGKATQVQLDTVVYRDTVTTLTLSVPHDSVISGSANDTLTTGFYFTEFTNFHPYDGDTASVQDTNYIRYFRGREFQADTVVLGLGNDSALTDSVLQIITHRSIVMLDTEGNAIIINDTCCGGGGLKRAENVEKVISIAVHPNPFVGMTTIQYSINIPSHVSIHIYNNAGKIVRTLQQEEDVTAGTHKFDFRSADIPAGYYTLVIRSGKTVTSKELFIEK
ncbi:MAG: T9SS type A sorting domain-containing protein [Ignavibacteriae bacterium]|nr:T9SS type A sorting domain-containing protein [Ignavibacteriota bacterium]MCB9217351.1 T9SS type A sorting domain-containing protein [Ignavibacteria bacterium]